MPRFKFKLQTVMDVKEKRVEKWQLELARRQLILAGIEQEKNSIICRIGQLQENWRAAMLNKPEVNDLMFFHRHRLYLHKLLEQKEMERWQALCEVNNAREKLIAAKKEHEILKKLREKSYKTYLACEAKNEQKFLDELGNNAFARKMGR